MKKISRRSFLKATAVLGVAGALAACGGGNGNSGGNAGGNAGGGNAGGGDAPMPVVKMLYTMNAVQPDQDMIIAAASAITEAKLGVRLEAEVIPVSSYRDQLNLILSGSEKYDLVMAFGNNLSAYVAKDGLLPMDEYMDQYGQGMIQELGDYAHAEVLNGETYAVPALRVMASKDGVLFRKDIVDQYNIDLSSIHQESDLTPIFERLHALEPDMYMVRPESVSTTFGWIGSTIYDGLGDNMGVLPNAGQDTTVVAHFDLQGWIDTCKLHYAWNQAGYIPADLLTTTDYAWDLVAARKLFAVEMNVKPGIIQEKVKAAAGTELVYVEFDAPAMSYTGKVVNFSWAIPQCATEPEAAMKVLNLLYTDSEFVNLMDWGIEGVHYVHTGEYDNVITFPDGVDASTSGYLHNYNFMFGNQLKSFVFLGDEHDLWDQMKVFNDTALKSKALGFAFDSSPVKTAYTAVSNVFAKYEPAIAAGFMSYDSTIETYKSEMYAAGLQAIIDEKQKQLDAWRAANS